MSQGLYAIVLERVIIAAEGYLAYFLPKRCGTMAIGLEVLAWVRGKEDSRVYTAV